MGFPRPRLHSRYDVVVIGAGISGLVCACTLAGRGLRVLLAEKHYRVGGYCSSFRRKKFHFDAAVHHISGCGKLSIVGSCFRNLGIQLGFTRLDPMDTLVFPGWSAQIPGAIEDFRSDLKARFPREQRAVDGFFQDLLRLYRAVLGNPRSGEILERYGALTLEDMLDRFFDEPRIRHILCGQWGYLGSPPGEISAVGMCQMLVNYWRDGAYYPEGGTQNFADAIGRKFVENGGHLLIYRGVEKIFVTGGRVSGVRLEDGKEIRTPLVVSCADPHQTFSQLVDHVPDRSYRQKLETLRISPSFFLLYLGVDAECRLQRLKRGFYFQSEEWNSENRWMYVSVPTELEPRLAPQGKQIVTVVLWLTEQERRETRDWSRFREAKTRQTLNWLSEFVPRLSRHIEVLETAVPATLNKYTSNFRGAPYGWAVIPSQSGTRRLAHETPVENLFLTGHWTIPGPGVCAVLASGWRLANRILAASRSPAGLHRSENPVPGSAGPALRERRFH